MTTTTTAATTSQSFWDEPGNIGVVVTSVLFGAFVLGLVAYLLWKYCRRGSLFSTCCKTSFKMDDTDRNVSIKLYDVMNQVGVSERIRKLYQDMAILKEIIWTITVQNQGVPLTFYIFGSNYEGTTTIELHSDIDIVFCDEMYPVIDDIHDATRGQCYLMLREDHTYPGYVKLQLVNDGIPLTIQNTEIPDDHDIDIEGRICKRHFNVALNGHERERHGPADAHPGSKDYGETDGVYGLRCKTIRMCAREWYERRQRYNWPSSDIFSKMSELGSVLVGVGHNSSSEPHLEWRVSFSFQERLLMFSLNPTQHKCYVLLKMIKKDVIKAKIGECISSYHCKTCLFHAIEVTPAAIWRPDNLVCCVRRCLTILLTWVVNGICPNFFLPSENMFDKPQFRAKRNRLLKLLRALIADGNSIMLRLQCDGVRDRLLQSEIIHEDMSSEIMYPKYLDVCKQINVFSFNMYDIPDTRDNSAICKNVLTLSKHLEHLTNTRVIGEHTEEQTRDAISYVIPVLHQHIGQRLASLACKGQGQGHARQLLYLSIHHFQHGKRADLMTSRLLVVSLLLRLNQYELCEVILEDIGHDFESYVVTECSCAYKQQVANENLLHLFRTQEVPCKTAISTVYAGCVKFARCDKEITPLPLQYEMYRSKGAPQPSTNFLFDLAAVDGKIYLFFLQYIVYSRLNKLAKKQVSIDNLVCVLVDDPNISHKETANNLLGWIYVQEGQILEALRCFLTSWQRQPIYNAAKFHVLNLARDVIREAARTRILRLFPSSM